MQERGDGGQQKGDLSCNISGSAPLHGSGRRVKEERGELVFPTHRHRAAVSEKEDAAKIHLISSSRVVALGSSESCKSSMCE